MISRFQFRASTNSRAEPRPELGPQAPPALRHLLAALRGRHVAVVVNGQRYAGKLITLDPLLLVGPDGGATAFSYEMVHSIQF